VNEPSARQEQLDHLRRTYAEYELDGRGRLWDLRNPGYARLSRDRDQAIVDLIQRSLPPGGSVLDLGCGGGHLAELVREAIGTVRWTGVDLLPQAVGAASSHYPWATWIEASADAVPFATGTADVVVCSTLFSSLPARELEDGVAREAGRVMRPGGWLVWYDLRYDNPANRAVHGIDRGRLRQLFPGWQSELRSITLLPPLARRLGFLTPGLYPVLHAIPLLRSHLVGRLERPIGS
jgi:SAM-dependent methyltransferase